MGPINKAAMSPLKPWQLLVTFFAGMAVTMLAMAAMMSEDLILEHRNNRLEFAAPRTDFFAGKSAKRLENALEVPFVIQTTLWSGTNKHVFRTAVDRFVVSEDIWDKSFQVVKLAPPQKAKSHLTAKEAQAWCVSQMSLETTGLSGTEPLWARLEIRAEDSPRQGSSLGASVDNTGIILSNLIDIFSRPAGPLPNWTLDYAPGFTLDSLRHTRGS